MFCDIHVSEGLFNKFVMHDFPFLSIQKVNSVTQCIAVELSNWLIYFPTLTV
jgi:hypothetical protein